MRGDGGMTAIVIDGSAKRDRWRATTTVYRAAMKKALASVPVGNGTMLDVAEAIAASPEVPVLARIAWQDVTQFERWNSDIQTWAPVLINTVKPGINDVDAVIDAIFILAGAFEAQDPAAIQSAAAALTARLA